MNEVEMQAPRVILKLNTSVLNALFPEASEARVQLQQAVLAELTRATIKGAITGDLAEFLKRFTDEVNKGIDKKGIVESFFTSSGSYWNRTIDLKPDTAITKALTQAATSAIEQQFFNALENAAEARVQLYIDQLESKVEYAVKQRIDRLTSDAINARVTAAVDAARATL